MALSTPLPIQLSHALEPLGVVRGSLLEATDRGMRLSIPKSAAESITQGALYRASIHHRLKRFELIVRAMDIQSDTFSGATTLQVEFQPGDEAQARAVLPYLLEEASAVV